MDAFDQIFVMVGFGAVYAMVWAIRMIAHLIIQLIRIGVDRLAGDLLALYEHDIEAAAASAISDSRRRHSSMMLTERDEGLWRHLTHRAVVHGDDVKVIAVPTATP